MAERNEDDHPTGCAMVGSRNMPPSNGFSISSPNNGAHRHIGTMQNLPENLNLNLNLNFHDPLIHELNQLKLSTPTHHHQSAAAYGISSLNGFSTGPVARGESINGCSGPAAPILIPFSRQPNSAYANPRNTTQYNSNGGPYFNSNGDLQSMRVQSAVRGELGIYMQGYPSTIEAALNFPIPDHHHHYLDNFYNLYVNGAHEDRSLLVAGANNRSGNRFQDSGGSVRNSSLRFDTNNYCQRIRGRSYSSGDYENLGGLALCNNHGLVARSRPYHSFSSLEELRGNIFSVAKDQNGCRSLQKIFEGGKPEEIQMIFAEVKEYVKELMVDQFGNYLIQKMFEVCNADQITQLLLRVVNDERSLMDACRDTHGTRAMQKLLEHLTTPEQKTLVVSVLRRITVPLTKNMNGHHVIQHCLRFFSNEDNKHILNVVADNCLDIATDKSGCCVLQQCVAHAEGEPQNRLMAEITANALVLSEHPYGNYVVQYIVGLKMPHATSDVLAQLSGHYVSLSTNKYGSNVVEKCMKEASEEQAMQIIREIMGSPNFLTVLQDPYGNYVAQSAFDIAKGSIRHTMTHLIQMHYSFLHSHPHGKRVLARARGSKQRV